MWKAFAFALASLAALVMTAPGLCADDFEVRLRGPLHEAFAEPTAIEVSAALVVPKQPPEAIDEVPAEYRLSDENAVWIPGYWGWDDETEDFVWISGLWRVAPPNQRWVPGYWAKTENGYRWGSGFWTNVDEEQLVYLPAPPEAEEGDPETNAPSESHFWVPGHYRYVDRRYVWRRGFWSPGHANWIWVPARYVWTPRGVIYRGGYWDYLMVNRGLVFAPVYFTPAVYTRANFHYRPSHVIDAAHLLVHLFVRPRYGHYYFGDYYGPAYDRYQIYPWVTYARRYRWRDPLYAYYSTREARDLDRIVRLYTYFSSDRALRPARTFQAQRELLRRRGQVDADVLAVATLGANIKSLVERDRRRPRTNVEADVDVRFQQQINLRQVTEEQQREIREEAASVYRRLAENRGRVEAEVQVQRPVVQENGEVQIQPTGELELPRARKGRDRVPRRDTDRPDRDQPKAEDPDGKRPGKRPERPGEKRPERPDGKQPERPDGKRPERPDGKQPERPDVKEPERPKGKRPEPRRPDRPDVKDPERPDVKKPDPKRPDVKKPKKPEKEPKGPKKKKKEEEKAPSVAE